MLTSSERSLDRAFSDRTNPTIIPSPTTSPTTSPKTNPILLARNSVTIYLWVPAVGFGSWKKLEEELFFSFFCFFLFFFWKDNFWIIKTLKSRDWANRCQQIGGLVAKPYFEGNNSYFFYCWIKVKEKGHFADTTRGQCFWFWTVQPQGRANWKWWTSTTVPRHHLK